MNTVPVSVRSEHECDHDAIRRIHRLAFGREDEGQLVDALRAAGDLRLSLVAVIDGELVGHILFSALPIVTDTSTVAALALGPLAVVPNRQREGVGSALVRQGLDACRLDGHQIVIVLGHREYYPRFGFSSQLATKLKSPFSGESWMAAELAPGALEGVDGTVTYPAPWGVIPA